MLRRLPPVVDRSFAKMVAYKRLFTGLSSVVAAAVFVVMGLRPHPGPAVYPFLAAAIFVFVGAWALRDGVSVLRELSRSARSS